MSPVRDTGEASGVNVGLIGGFNDRRRDASSDDIWDSHQAATINQWR